MRPNRPLSTAAPADWSQHAAVRYHRARPDEDGGAPIAHGLHGQLRGRSINSHPFHQNGRNGIERGKILPRGAVRQAIDEELIDGPGITAVTAAHDRIMTSGQPA